MATKACRENCKWCAKGECWNSGQIEKPAGAQSNKKKEKKGNTGNAAPQKKLMAMLKGGAAGNSGPAQMMKMMMALMGQQSSEKTSSDTCSNAKQALHQAHQKAAPGEAISYETNQVNNEGPNEFQSQVTVGGQTFAGECAFSKKLAEANAAKVAIDELYPGKFKGPAAKRQKGQKRPKMSMESLPPKAQLSRLINFQKGSFTKDDITVTIEGAEGAYTATVSVPQLKATHRGTGSCKKTAEAAALDAVIKDKKIKAQLAKADAELAARKKAKNEEAMAKFKEKHPQHFEKKQSNGAAKVN